MRTRELIKKLVDADVEEGSINVQFLGDDGVWHDVTGAKVVKFHDTEGESTVVVIKGRRQGHATSG